MSASAAAGRLKPPACDSCKMLFQSGQTILTSVTCGHSFHRWLHCVEDLEGYQRFDRVEVFTGGCRLKGCEYDGNLVQNSSEASPTTLLFRNLPLEELVKTVGSPIARRSPVVPVVEITQPRKRDTKRASSAASGSPIKRVKVDPVVTVVKEEEESPTNPISKDDGQQQQISAFDIPWLAQSDLSDSDDEEDERAIAGLIAASQALQQLPKDNFTVYENTEQFDEHAASGDNSKQETDTEEDEDQEEPPPGPYGMPPLSQWKRSSRR